MFPASFGVPSLCTSCCTSFGAALLVRGSHHGSYSLTLAPTLPDDQALCLSWSQAPSGSWSGSESRSWSALWSASQSWLVAPRSACQTTYVPGIASGSFTWLTTTREDSSASFRSASLARSVAVGSLVGRAVAGRWRYDNMVGFFANAASCCFFLTVARHLRFPLCCARPCGPAVPTWMSSSHRGHRSVVVMSNLSFFFCV